MEIPKIVTKHWQVLLVAGLMLFSIGWRLIPHVPNFAPVGALALVGGTVLGWRLGALLSLSAMALSDLVLGFYPGIEWTWLAVALATGLGYGLRRLPALYRVGFGALGASLIFFIVSNFGVWIASGMYVHTFAGLIQCYAMGLPFLRATVLSDLVFTVLFIGCYELAFARWRAPQRLALKNFSL